MEYAVIDVNDVCNSDAASAVRVLPDNSAVPWDERGAPTYEPGVYPDTFAENGFVCVPGTYKYPKGVTAW